MTSGGMKGELGAVYVSVVPSMAGISGAFAQHASDHAKEYSQAFGTAVQSALTRETERIGERAAQAMAEKMASTMAAAGPVAIYQNWGRSLVTPLAKIGEEAGEALSAGIVKGTEVGWLRPRVMATGASLGSDLGTAIGAEMANKFKIAAQAMIAEQEALKTRLLAIRAQMDAAPAPLKTDGSGGYASMLANAEAYRVAQGKALTAGELTATQQLNYLKQYVPQLREAAAAQRELTAAQALSNIQGTAQAAQLYQRAISEFEAAASRTQMRQITPLFNTKTEDFDKFGQQWKKYGENYGKAMAEGTETGFHTWLPNVLGQMGVSPRITALFKTQSARMAEMWNKALAEETAKAKAEGFAFADISASGPVMANYSAKMAEFGQLASKAAMVGAAGAAAVVFEMIVRDVSKLVGLVKTEIGQFAAVGKEAGNTLMTSFADVVAGKAPDIMGAFNVIEDGLKAVWMAPQNVFNTGIDIIVGHIPVIGGAVQNVVHEVEGAINSVFPLFDQLKVWAGTFMGTMAEIGGQWQEIGRTIAGQTLDTESLEEYLGIVREIGSSGLVLHFEDVAKVVGELSQRLEGLSNGAGLNKEQLTELSVTLAEGNELLGNIHINVDALTAAFNSFGVPAQATNEILTEFVNISRMTGADINSVLHDVEASGPAFQDLGFNIQETYYMMAKFNEELGSPAMQRFVLSLRGMPENFAKLHIDPKVGYEELIKSIQELTKPGSSALNLELALNMASRFMSKSAATTFIQGIKLGFAGTPEEVAAALERWRQGAHGIKQPLEEALEATKGIKDTIKVISTQFFSALGPLALGFANSFKDAGNTITEWIKQHQSQIVGWATTVMEKIVSTASGIIRFASGLLEEFAPIVDGFVKFFLGNFKLIDAAILASVQMLDALPTSLHLGINTQKMINDLQGIMNPLNQMLSIPIETKLKEWGNAGIGFADTLNNKLLPPLAKIGAISQTYAQYNEASLEPVKKPGEKEEKIQTAISSIGAETYTAAAGQEANLAKAAQIVRDMKDVNVHMEQVQTPGGAGLKLSGAPDELNKVYTKLEDLGLFRSQYEPLAIRILGDEKQWEDFHNKFKKLGIDIDIKDGVVTGIKAGSEKAGSDFKSWWKELTGNLPPIVANITVDPRVGGPGTGPDANQSNSLTNLFVPPVPGHAFGGPVPSDGWVRGHYVPGKDTVPMDLPVGSYVIRRSVAQANADLLNKVRRGYATGGTVPAMVQPGEIIMPPNPRLRPFYDALNYGTFDDGGLADMQRVAQQQSILGFAHGLAKGFGFNLPGYGDPRTQGPASLILPFGLTGAGTSGRGASAFPTAGHGTTTLPAIPAGSARVPVVQRPDGSWTSPNAAWAHLMQRESSGRNIPQGNIGDVNNRTGDLAKGYFQITTATWRAHGGEEFAPDPMQATVQQQAVVAARIFLGNPKHGADWGAGLSGREDPNELMAGLVGYATGGPIPDGRHSVAGPGEGGDPPGTIGYKPIIRPINPYTGKPLFEDPTRKLGGGAVCPCGMHTGGVCPRGYSGGGDVHDVDESPDPKPGESAAEYESRFQRERRERNRKIADYPYYTGQSFPGTKLPSSLTSGASPHPLTDYGFSGKKFHPDIARLGSSFGTFLNHRYDKNVTRIQQLFGENPFDQLGLMVDPSNHGLSDFFPKDVPGFAGGGVVGVQGFDGGGPAITQVIWSNTETGQNIGVGNGGWTDDSYYADNRSAPGQGWGGHTGHVHTTVLANPFTGEPYGLDPGADIQPGKPGFPQWVYELGNRFGLQPSTYPGHQVFGGRNHGIDWWPAGKKNNDLSDRGYSHEDHVALTSFAQAAGTASVGSPEVAGAPGFSGVGGKMPVGDSRASWSALRGGAPSVQLTGFGGAGTVPASGGTPWSTGTGVGSGGSVTPPVLPGAGDAPPGRTGIGYHGPGSQLPPELQEIWDQIGPTFKGWNPIDNLPATVGGNSVEAQKYWYEFENYLNGLRKASAGLDEAVNAAAASDKELERAKREAGAAQDKWNKTLAAMIPSERDHPELWPTYPEYQDMESKRTAYENMLTSNQQAHQRVLDSQISSAQEAIRPAPEVPKGDEQRYYSMSENMGSKFVEGVAQGLGLGEVWKSFSGGSAKPFWEWGIWKLMAGGLSFGAGLMNRPNMGVAGMVPSVNLPSPSTSGPADGLPRDWTPDQQQQQLPGTQNLNQQLPGQPTGKFQYVDEKTGKVFWADSYQDYVRQRDAALPHEPRDTGGNPPVVVPPGLQGFPGVPRSTEPIGPRGQQQPQAPQPTLPQLPGAPKINEPKAGAGGLNLPGFTVPGAGQAGLSAWLPSGSSLFGGGGGDTGGGDDGAIIPGLGTKKQLDPLVSQFASQLAHATSPFGSSRMAGAMRPAGERVADRTPAGGPAVVINQSNHGLGIHEVAGQLNNQAMGAGRMSMSMISPGLIGH